MQASKKPGFYLSVINGDSKKLYPLFENEPEGLRESLILSYAFDKLEELGDGESVDFLLSYIDNEIHEYESKKCGTLSLLGALGNEGHVAILESYLDSKDHYLSFNSLCSLCQLVEREVLSRDVVSRLILRFVKILHELDCSVEEAVECARLLKLINHEKADELIIRASSRMSEFKQELASVL